MAKRTTGAKRPPSPPRAKRPAVATPKQERRAVLILVVPTRAGMEVLGPLLIDMGVQATVLAGQGLTAVLADRLPFFGGLASMLPSGVDAAVVVSVTEAALAEQVIDAVERAEAGEGVVAAAFRVDRLGRAPGRR